MQIGAWFAGITLAVSITIGVVNLSLSHTFGNGKTKVSYSVTAGQAKIGQSTCVDGCNPNSTAENTQSLNLSGDPLVFALSRTNGRSQVNVGAGASVKDRTGLVKLRISAIKSYNGADALSVLDSWPVRAILPNKVNQKAHDWLAEPKGLSAKQSTTLTEAYAKFYSQSVQKKPVVSNLYLNPALLRSLQEIEQSPIRLSR